MSYRKSTIAILGSTGSIGSQALDVVRAHPDALKVELLTAHAQWQDLARQAIEFKPKSVVIADKHCYPALRDALAPHKIKVYAGEESIEQMVQSESIDTVLSAIVGYAGLLPTVRAIEAGKKIALANKESLVVAGQLVTSMAGRYNASIVPVDSEHSAIYQCLAGEMSMPEKLILTASGGPFRGYSHDKLAAVTPLEALRHPAWSMGAKITIDSATLMNKGLEVIEAHWLFNMPYEQIEVVIHPQAVVHSMVQFSDGSIKAQMGVADMRIPIQYAFTHPYRIESGFMRYSFGPGESLTFDVPDSETFPCLDLAIEAGKLGGTAPCVLNAANEVAVKAFLNEEISFTTIPLVVERACETIQQIESPTLDDIIRTHEEAIETAEWLVEKLRA